MAVVNRRFSLIDSGRECNRDLSTVVRFLNRNGVLCKAAMAAIAPILEPRLAPFPIVELAAARTAESVHPHGRNGKRNKES